MAPGQSQQDIEAEASPAYSERVLDHVRNPRNVGRIPDADGYASVMGACGDNMEMWLKVKDGRVQGIAFWTDGCEATIACGSVATEMARGRTLGEAMAVNAETIAGSLGGLPEDHAHCAGLAALTLKKAIIEYLNLRREPWRKAYNRR